ncbi:MAG: hypothetical protein H0X30_34755, partial [Anaerolineae bacterium]|nr:hypothetical protein [Anaerolineae bacterium]
MTNSPLTNTNSLVLLPPDPLISNSHCRHALLQSLTEKPVYQAALLQNRADTVREESYCCFSATKIAADLRVWDLDDRQSQLWWAAIFPSPIMAVMIPVIHSQSLYHQLLTEHNMPLTEEISVSIDKLVDSQKRYLRSITSPIR